MLLLHAVLLIHGQVAHVVLQVTIVEVAFAQVALRLQVHLPLIGPAAVQDQPIIVVVRQRLLVVPMIMEAVAVLLVVLVLAVVIPLEVAVVAVLVAVILQEVAVVVVLVAAILLEVAVVAVLVVEVVPVLVEVVEDKSVLLIKMQLHEKNDDYKCISSVNYYRSTCTDNI